MEARDFSIGNAAGTAKRFDQVQLLARTAVTAITVGSGGERKRDGNSGVMYGFNGDTRTSANAFGIPDANGSEGWKIVLPKMVEVAKREHKQLRFSAAAFNGPHEYGRMAALAYECGVHRVVLNVGCPNIRAIGGKSIPSYNPGELDEILEIVGNYIGTEDIELKLSPIDNALIPQLAAVIRKHKIVTGIEAVNTLPHQRLQMPDGTSALNYTGEDGKKYETGGLAGAPLKEHGLRVVREFRRELGDGFGIIGVGGIFTSDDVADYVTAGADGIQVATAYLEYGPKIFEELLQGL